MIAVSVEPQVWPRRRWVVILLAVFMVQLALIFWLARQKPVAPPVIIFGPKVYLPADSRAEWPGLSDPTRFVLANHGGFSGSAWMKVSPPAEMPAWTKPWLEWTEPPRPLSSPPAYQLGGALAEFVRTNLAGTFRLAPRPDPQFAIIPSWENTGTAQSSMTIEGDLANRRLLSEFKLESWPLVNDLLTNSVVQAGVDQEGNVFSAVLLTTSGSKDADARALNLAVCAKFQPSRWTGPAWPATPQTRLQWGRLVFHWHTIPAPATNALPGNTPPANTSPPNVLITSPHE